MPRVFGNHVHCTFLLTQFCRLRGSFFLRRVLSNTNPFLNRIIWPTDKTLIRTTTSGQYIDQSVIVRKGYSIVLKPPESVPHRLMQFCAIPRASILRSILSLYKGYSQCIRSSTERFSFNSYWEMFPLSIRHIRNTTQRLYSYILFWRSTLTRKL